MQGLLTLLWVGSEGRAEPDARAGHGSIAVTSRLLRYCATSIEGEEWV